eukprot:CAMPEP_0203765366 /NCGR_PEP_ID=MMETSP0098-20131031/18377_1 /ASSEMBLY_ACC=CAM_ASM_000208 /TAXON_ID=96639 /ORGANISM=" , Strain NY0313808BC1" /LENGTH=179 /DNA_ID=CAMNT_0050661619 /DNA_START=614 /DNA_END=1151 /DNA_ORIENTATION=+
MRKTTLDRPHVARAACGTQPCGKLLSTGRMWLGPHVALNHAENYSRQAACGSGRMWHSTMRKTTLDRPHVAFIPDNTLLDRPHVARAACGIHTRILTAIPAVVTCSSNTHPTFPYSHFTLPGSLALALSRHDAWIGLDPVLHIAGVAAATAPGGGDHPNDSGSLALALSRHDAWIGLDP